MQSDKGRRKPAAVRRKRNEQRILRRLTKKDERPGWAGYFANRIARDRAARCRRNAALKVGGKGRRSRA